MDFNTPLFLVFFSAFFIFYYFVARTRSQRLWLVAAGSLAFYGAWNIRFVPVLLGTGTANYFMGLGLAREENERRRKMRLVAGVAFNLAVLVLFKYACFFIENASSLGTILGSSRTWSAPAVLFPVGISFYTLQCIAYQTDVHRRTIEPSRRLRDFLAALTFFPRLAAGPFVRWADWLPQFDELKSADWHQIERAFLLISFGLVKKTVADLVSPIADGLFQTPGPHTALECWTGVLAFAGQIYGDFAGYTDIAIGCSLLLGFSIPPNFDLPYASISPIKFWRRWHISFSQWLYEYVYLPMALQYREHPALCLMVTVLLAGLWHGAKWTFVLYGIYHGILLAATYWSFMRIPERWASGRAWLPRVVMTAATFYFVLLGFAVFRAETVSQALDLWLSMHRATRPSAPTFDSGAPFCAAAAAVVFCHALDFAALKTEIGRRPVILWPATVAGFVFSFVFGYSGKVFVYFSF